MEINGVAAFAWLLNMPTKPPEPVDPVTNTEACLAVEIDRQFSELPDSTAIAQAMDATATEILANTMGYPLCVEGEERPVLALEVSDGKPWLDANGGFNPEASLVVSLTHDSSGCNLGVTRDLRIASSQNNSSSPQPWTQIPATTSTVENGKLVEVPSGAFARGQVDAPTSQNSATATSKTVADAASTLAAQFKTCRLAMPKAHPEKPDRAIFHSAGK